MGNNNGEKKVSFDFKEYIKQQGEEFFSNSLEYKRAYAKWRKEKFPEKVKAEQKKYHAKVQSRDSYAEDHRRYCQYYRMQNTDKVKAYNNQYYKEYLTDPVNREKHDLRTALRRTIVCYEKGMESTGRARILQYIGLSGIAELIEYLEINIPQGYTMKSFLKKNPSLTLDHIRPLREAKTIEEVRAFFHYTNLRLVERRKNFTGRPKKVAK